MKCQSRKHLQFQLFVTTHFVTFLLNLSFHSIKPSSLADTRAHVFPHKTHHQQTKSGSKLINMHAKCKIASEFIQFETFTEKKVKDFS